MRSNTEKIQHMFTEQRRNRYFFLAIGNGQEPTILVMVVIVFEFTIGKYIGKPEIGIALISNLSNNFFQGRFKNVNGRSGCRHTFTEHRQKIFRIVACRENSRTQCIDNKLYCSGFGNGI